MINKKNPNNNNTGKPDYREEIEEWDLFLDKLEGNVDKSSGITFELGEQPKSKSKNTGGYESPLSKIQKNYSFNIENTKINLKTKTGELLGYIGLNKRIVKGVETDNIEFDIKGIYDEEIVNYLFYLYKKYIGNYPDVLYTENKILIRYLLLNGYYFIDDKMLPNGTEWYVDSGELNDLVSKDLDNLVTQDPSNNTYKNTYYLIKTKKPNLNLLLNKIKRNTHQDVFFEDCNYELKKFLRNNPKYIAKEQFYSKDKNIKYYENDFFIFEINYKNQNIKIISNNEEYFKEKNNIEYGSFNLPSSLNNNINQKAIYSELYFDKDFSEKINKKIILDVLFEIIKKEFGEKPSFIVSYDDYLINYLIKNQNFLPIIKYTENKKEQISLEQYKFLLEKSKNIDTLKSKISKIINTIIESENLNSFQKFNSYNELINNLNKPSEIQSTESKDFIGIILINKDNIIK